ncbi:hypothetical protein KT99_05167 [Shewanella benthica KT99]|uniref:Transposase n=1 Tax=Shewanella benthica KT99 TaxID=314608 RepID=A9D8S1_9GAMM|nr:hypothetical protein KT99_05167 [Shewanella benthica KT99]
MGCQKEIAKLIVKQKADYILALKGHHSGLQGELEAWWHKCQREGFTADNFDEHTTIDSGHGRIETRRCQQVLVNKSWLNNKYQWVGLKSIIKVTSDVHEKTTTESRIRKGRGPLAFNVMRKIAMTLFKQEQTKRASIVAKKKMAGLDDEYRSTLLESGIKMR